MIKQKVVLFGLALVALGAIGFGGTDPAALNDDTVISRVRNHETLKRVTKERFKMDSVAAQMCRAGPAPHSPHENRYCHVFVSENAAKAMESGNKKYPTGALIVKAKYVDQKSPEVELFTVMIKRESNYDAKHGDWEYLLVDGRCRTLYARGRLDSCIQCHEDYAESDFVTRHYMPRKAAGD